MVGGDDNDMYIDNVSLKVDAITDISKFNIPGSDFKLFTNYPNPFNPSTQIEFYLPETSLVILTVYNTLGQKLASYINSVKSAGSHKKEITLENVSSGVYYYSIDAQSIDGNNHLHQVRKMILLK